MRGSNTLFSDIFTAPSVPITGKGRNADLHKKRNEALIDRYFYYGKQGLSYEECIRRVSDEFFISIHTVPYLISDHVDQLKALKRENPGEKYFRLKWPRFAW